MLLVFTAQGEKLIAGVARPNASVKNKHKRLQRLVVAVADQFLVPHGKNQIVTRTLTIVP